MRIVILALIWALGSASTGVAQDIQPILQSHVDEITDPSRRTVVVALSDLAASGSPQVIGFLEHWQDKRVWQRDSDGVFFLQSGDGAFIDIDTGQLVSETSDGFTQLKPNGGVRRVIGTTLVQFQLTDPDLSRRTTAVASIARRPEAAQLAPLLASIEGEPNVSLMARKTQLANFLMASFGETTEDRITAINSLSGDTSVEARAVLNQILTVTLQVSATPPNGNLARILKIPDDLALDEAYATLVSADLAPAIIASDGIRIALSEHIDGGRVGTIPVAQLNTTANRAEAYGQLAASGRVLPLVTVQDQIEAVDASIFAEVYDEPNADVTNAAAATLAQIETRVAAAQTVDVALDALSLASIYFLAAIGLAITFGVMGVINMAHGEFIMMGAYTGYVVQLFVPSYTASILIALPVAFMLTFAAGVAMERLVIRHLYHRPLETLLATFGISIALQQLAKNIFGTQARPLTSPAWLDGALVFSDVIQISYIRIAIFILAVLFLVLILFVLNRTRLGLEVRAVTQNPGMAASMGINPDRINMLTFGFGSGIAGIAGVAIGLYAKVTSEMGADYIVQSFMTVVVGGVGNVWGTLAGASMIGFLQKTIEVLNPSNTLAAQTYMVLFIILFIQFRPKGIIAQKGRAAAD